MLHVRFGQQRPEPGVPKRHVPRDELEQRQFGELRGRGNRREETVLLWPRHLASNCRRAEGVVRAAGIGLQRGYGVGAHDVPMHAGRRRSLPHELLPENAAAFGATEVVCFVPDWHDVALRLG